MEKLENYIESNKDRFLEELKEFLRIPSVSSQTSRNQDTARCARWVANALKDANLENIELLETGGHPIVYADWMHAGETSPTILIYGHYDVQPAEPVDLWSSPPFEPVVKNGYIFARGTADDKGQLYTHIKAVEALFKTEGKLPCNIKFMIEGEEECGSSHLEDFILYNAEKLKCDYAIVSDTEWFAEGLPTICYALRGICYTELTVKGPNRDLHSGSFGGAVDNPINVLCKIISKLIDENGKIAVPNLYDNVLELSQQERDAFKKLPYNEEKYMKDLGVKALNGEKGFTTLERNWARPSLDVNGIFGGYTEEGAKTVLPSFATAKISIRLVANQKSEEVYELLNKYIQEIAPATVKAELTYIHGGEPVMVDMNEKPIKACEIALKKAFGVEPVFMREGGSIGIVALFGSVLHAPTVLMGLGLPTDNIHSPDENFSLDNFYGGIRASAFFLQEISKEQLT